MTFEQIEFLANGLMDIHGLHEWNFAFNNRKTAVGLCSHVKKTIYVSKAFVVGMTDEDIEDTILHEIAHALVGAGNGHNMVWYNKAVEIGCKGATTARDKKTPSRVERGAKWVCVCPQMKIVDSWFRKPRQTTFAKLPYMYVKSRKAETEGKLKIITIDEYNRLTS